MNPQAIDFDALAQQSGAVGATPTQPSGPVDYDALAQQSGAIGATPQQPAPAVTVAPQQPPVYQPFAPDDPFGLKKAREQIKGYVKGGMQTAAGALEIAANPLDPGNMEEGNVKAFRDFLRAHSKPSNPEQEKALFVEAASEFLPFMGEEAPTVAAKYGTKMEMAKFAEKYPKIAALFNTAMGAARGAVEQGTQTYLKSGEDPEKTRQAAETGGIFGGGGAFLGETIPRFAKAVGDTIESLRPGETKIGAGRFETKPGTDELLLRNLKDVTQDPATAAVDEATGDIAKTGVLNSMLTKSAKRARVVLPEKNTARLLAPPEGHTPGITIGTTPPRFVGDTPRTTTETVQNATQTVPNPDYEAPAGELAPPVPGQTAEATAGQIGEPLTGVTPERTYTGPERADTRNATQRRIDAARGQVPARMLTPPETVEQPVYQQRPVVTQPESPVTTHPERATEMQPDQERLGGGGTLILTNDGNAMSVEKARAVQNAYQRVMDGPEFNEMGVRQQRAIQDAHADITGQLRRYDNYAASQPHFPEQDHLQAVTATRSLGDASHILKESAAPFWQVADKESGGVFTNLREEEKFIEKKLYGDNPIGNREDLLNDLAENQRKQMAFFDEHRANLSPEEWEAHRDQYQDGIVIGNLHNFIESSFNGITRADIEAAAPGELQRVFEPGKGFNKQFEKFLNTGTNREVLNRTIGPDHILNIKRVGQLFEGAERMEQSKGLLDTLASTIHKHYHGIRGLVATGAMGMYGARVGMKLAEDLGAIPATGIGVATAATGPAITGTYSGMKRYIVDRLVSDPDFLKQFSYAIRSGIPKSKAATLLAAHLIQGGRIAAQYKNRELKQPAPAQPQAQPAKEEP